MSCKFLKAEIQESFSSLEIEDIATKLITAAKYKMPVPSKSFTKFMMATKSKMAVESKKSAKKIKLH